MKTDAERKKYGEKILVRYIKNATKRGDNVRIVEGVYLTDTNIRCVLNINGEEKRMFVKHNSYWAKA
tara:strand:- start:933 stop:1133 length:201 start_codon:yes stop_codon:yes gene_type:complete